MAAAASIFVFQSEQIKRKKLIAEAPAQIVEMSPRKTINPETGETNRVLNVLVVYRYSIEGENFEKQTTVSKLAISDFRIGESAKACFNPARREQVELFPNAYECSE